METLTLLDMRWEFRCDRILARFLEQDLKFESFGNLGLIYSLVATFSNSKYVEISCTECIFLASCEDELNYHMGEEHARDFISYFESDFPCRLG